MRWGGAAIDPHDPALPAGVEALGDHVNVPEELARRLRQIGLITREEASRFMPMLKPGQRLLSPGGRLSPEDGLSRPANAPTAGARRLPGNDRLADIGARFAP